MSAPVTAEVLIRIDADASPLTRWLDGISTALAEVPSGPAQGLLERLERFCGTGQLEKRLSVECLPTGGTRDGVEVHLARIGVAQDLEDILAALRAGDWDVALRHLDDLLGGCLDNATVGAAGPGVESGSDAGERR